MTIYPGQKRAASSCPNRSAPATAGRLITIQQLFNRVAIARVAATENSPRACGLNALCERLHTRQTHSELIIETTPLSPVTEPRAMLAQIFVVAVCLALFMLPILTSFWGRPRG